MKILLLFALAMIQTSLFAQKEDAPKYFEGSIDYKIESTSHIRGVSDNEIRDRTGSKLQFFFKNGDYIREYKDEAGYTLRKMYYLKDINRVYIYDPINNPDTIYYFSGEKDFSVRLEIKDGTKETILDCNCSSSVIDTRYVSSFMPDTGQVIYTYFFCPSLPVNADWHKKVAVWYDVVKIHKSIAIKFIENDPQLFKQTYTATKINWQEIDDTIFTIDTKLIQKEMIVF